MHDHTCPTCTNAGRIQTGDTEVFCACPAGKAAFRAEQRATAALETWEMMIAIVRRERAMPEAA